MSSIEVIPVRTKKEFIQFIKFPWKIYKGDPYWVPPLIMDHKKLLDKTKNPFFKHADIEMFLAKENEEIVGRIAAIKNDLHNSTHNDKVGFFGFFESIDDQNVANNLLDSAKNWLLSKGLSAMRGPANPSSNDIYGLLIDGFNDPPRILMSYNPKYYIRLIESYGLLKAKDLFAYRIENQKVLQSDKFLRVSKIARERSGIKIRSLDMKNFFNELGKVKYVYNKAWAPNWGFVPMTDEEIDALAKDLKPLVEPSLVLFGEINDKTVGFALPMLDYNVIFKKMNGRLLPFGWTKLFTMKKEIKWARIIILGVIPEFQKKGLDSVFYHEIVERAAKLGIFLGEASWILEDNEMMNRGAQVLNGDIYKKYRLYEINIK